MEPIVSRKKFLQNLWIMDKQRQTRVKLRTDMCLRSKYVKINDDCAFGEKLENDFLTAFLLVAVCFVNGIIA